MDDDPRHCRDCRHLNPRTTLSGICLARPDGASTVTGFVLDDIPRRCEAFAEGTAQRPVRWLQALERPRTRA
jgi:hypothetical protein